MSLFSEIQYTLSEQWTFELDTREEWVAVEIIEKVLFEGHWMFPQLVDRGNRQGRKVRGISPETLIQLAHIPLLIDQPGSMILIMHQRNAVIEGLDQGKTVTV
jgi:hypothetical protein